MLGPQHGVFMALGSIVFALAFAVLIGRWVTAEENWLSFLVRGFLLALVVGLAFRNFFTIWYWLLQPLAVVPFFDICLGRDFSKAYREHELAETTAAAAASPDNPTLRLHLARALLGCGQIEAGLSALEEATRLGGASSREVMEQMAAKAKREFIIYCPSCGAPNPKASRACRRCLAPLAEGPLLGALLWVCRPLLMRVLPKMRDARRQA